MLREIKSLFRTVDGFVCRLAYRGNRTVDVLLPVNLKPEHAYLDTYLFTEEAEVIVQRAISEHEDALAEQRRLG
jgi:hypothetical protein